MLLVFTYRVNQNVPGNGELNDLFISSMVKKQVTVAPRDVATFE